jgi:hypothetical protein
MTDRLREALELLADRGQPSDPDEFAEQVLRSVPPRRSPGPPALVAVAALVAFVVAAVAVPALLDDDERVVSEPPASIPGTTDDTPSQAPRWQRIGLAEPAPYVRPFLNAVAASDGAFVAVGSIENRMARPAVAPLAFVSADGGASWRRSEGLSGPTRASLQDVTATATGFVAVGRAEVPGSDDDAAVWTSSDGREWSRAPDDGGVLGGPFIQAAEAVAAARGRVVAVGFTARGPDREAGATAAAWYSADGGRSWNRAVVEGPREATTSAGSVVATADGFVMGGGSTASDGLGAGRVWTSDDGAHWTPVQADEAVFPPVGTSVAALAAAPDLVVGVGTLGAVWTSPDGTRWTKVVQDSAAFGPLTNHLRAVHRLQDGTWLAVGWNNPGVTAAAWTSVDGSRWRQVVDPAFAAVLPGRAEDVASADGVTVVVGSEDLRPESHEDDRVPVVWVRR